jgi:UDP-4-amino-4,6-dideoxy-N-acetyl-beta-L-altrosamine N-acetyltransferase
MSAVVLRRLATGDSARVLAWRNSPAVAAFMYADHLIGPGEHARWFTSAVSDPDRRYWMIEVDGAPTGVANLVGIQPQHRRCDWAYYLAEPEARGRGVGSQVEFGVLDHVFGVMGLNKIWCEVLADNTPVLTLHKRFGFVREALFRSHVIKGGLPRDVVGLGLLKAEWDARREEALYELQRRGLEPAVIRG